VKTVEGVIGLKVANGSMSVQEADRMLRHYRSELAFIQAGKDDTEIPKFPWGLAWAITIPWFVFGAVHIFYLVAELVS
jgi:hypothetical protein